MSWKVDLTKAQFSALAAVDGTVAQPPMTAKIRRRLLDLLLIERREWPGGPLWRTPLGNRCVKASK